MNILISGAGVGGLSTAIGLQRAGHQVTVFEAAESLRVSGFGLNLWPNAIRAIYSLGLRSEFDKIALPVKRYLTLASDGRVLHEVNVSDWTSQYGAPAVGIYRRALARMLLSSLSPGTVRFGHRLLRCSQDAHGVDCVFANGRTVRGDALIGADGIRSATRHSLLGDPGYRENPFHADRWRGVVRLGDVSFDPLAETEVFDGESFFGSIPVNDEMGYWFASGPNMPDFDAFMKRYGGWAGSHVPGTIRATPRDSIGQTFLEDLAHLPDRWSVGRVTLLGDAAHAMMPDMAQGASQTFVDSWALTEAMARSHDVEEAFNAYESVRRPVAYSVVEASRKGLFALSEDGLTEVGVDPVAVRYTKEVDRPVDAGHSSDGATT